MIAQIIQQIEQLPPVPTIVQELQNLYYYDNYNTADVEAILRRDPNLVANILKIANSPYYGLPREFIDIRQAIAYFGLEQIIEFAMATIMDEIVKLDLHFYKITPYDFMKLAQYKSAITRTIIEDKTDKFITSNTAFLCDISKVIISNYAKERGLEPIEERRVLNELDVLEKERLDFDTIEVTKAMFEYWNFDNAMIELVANFKKEQTPRHRALFIARDVVTIIATLDSEHLEKYPEVKHRIEKITIV